MTKLLTEEKTRKSLEGTPLISPFSWGSWGGVVVFSLGQTAPTCSSRLPPITTLYSQQSNTRSWSTRSQPWRATRATSKTSWRSCSRKTRLWLKCISKRKTLCNSKWSSKYDSVHSPERRVLWTGGMCGTPWSRWFQVPVARQEINEGRAGATQQGESAVWGGRKSCGGRGAGQSVKATH